MDRAMVLVLALMSMEASKNFFQDDFQVITFKMLKCKINAKIIHQNFSCYAKSFNRSFSAFSIVGVTKVPLNDIFVKASISFKYGVIYREVIKTPLIDWCPLMITTSSLRLISQLIKMLKDSAPEMVHECPYNGLEVRNKTLKTATMRAVFPTGDYKIVINGFVRNETMGTLTSFLSFNSSNRDTFG